MKLPGKNNYKIAVFLLLWYCYLNGLRRFFMPFSSVTVPLLIAGVLILTASSAKGKIKFKGNEIVLCISWMCIAVMCTVNNSSLSYSFISGGMIQLYVMIAFLLFAHNSRGEWKLEWMGLTRMYSLIHAIATVIFYFNKNLFNSYASMMFSGEKLADVLKYYRYGMMTGLSGHFSTNGMILGVGFMFWFEYVLASYNANIKRGKKHIQIVALAVVTYALILTSKRGPLIFAVIAIVITNIIYRGKNVLKRLIAAVVIVLLLIVAYYYLSRFIPGLSTITDKFARLEESDAGVLNGRGGLWQRAIDMFKSSPIIGNGFGSYSRYATETNAITTSAHNYYLQLLAEFGIVGIIFYMMAFISGLANGYKSMVCAIKTNLLSKDSNRMMVYKVAFEMQTFVVLYNISATALMYYYILIPYFLACAVPRTPVTDRLTEC